MESTYRALPQLNSDDETILELQSSDADSSLDDASDSSSDGDVIHEKYANQQPSPDGTSSTWKATMNLVNYIEGVGFLSLPYSIKIGGITALLSLFVMPFICWYTGIVLVESLYENHEKKGKIRVRSTWKEIGDAISPKYGGKVVAWNQDFGFISLAVSYLILCGSLMSHALPMVPLSQSSWTCCAALIVLPTLFVKSYSQIAWLSTISVVAMALTVATTLWYGVDHINQWDASTLVFWDFDGVFISISIILHSYGAVPIIPPVEKSMKDRSKFGKALCGAFFITFLFKLILSLFGFFSFGFNTDEILVNNFPARAIRISVGVIFVVSALFSCVLCLNPVCESLEESAFFSRITSDLSNTVRDAMFRVSLLILSLAIALLLPHFALITALVGSVQSVVTSIWVPIAAHLKLKYHELNGFQRCVFLETPSCIDLPVPEEGEGVLLRFFLTGGANFTSKK